MLCDFRCVFVESWPAVVLRMAVAVVVQAVALVPAIAQVPPVSAPGVERVEATPQQATSQQATPPAAVSCDQRIAEATANSNGGLAYCQKNSKVSEAKITDLERRLSDADSKLKDALANRSAEVLGDIYKRLRPHGSEPLGDAAKTAAAIEIDIKDLQEERDLFRDKVGKLQARLLEIEGAIEREKEHVEREKQRLGAQLAENVDKLLQRPCALLARVAEGDGWRIEGIMPGGPEAKTKLQQDIDRAAPGSIRSTDITTIDADACLRRLGDDMVLVTPDKLNGKGPLQVDLGPDVEKLVGRLPSSETQCAAAFARLQSDLSVRDKLPGPRETVDLWVSKEGKGRPLLCRYQPSEWTIIGGVRPGKSALLVLMMRPPPVAGEKAVQSVQRPAKAVLPVGSPEAIPPRSRQGDDATGPPPN